MYNAKLKNFLCLN